MVKWVIVIVVLLLQYFSSLVLNKNEVLAKREEDIKAIVAKAKGGYFRNLALAIIINGWRPYLNNILWLKIITNEEENRYTRNIPLLSILTALSPEYEEVWHFHAWNYALNISKIEDDPEKSWRWIKYGISMIDKGLEYNPNSKSLLEWKALIIYNRALYEPIYQEKFYRDFQESPFRVAGAIYHELSERGRKINPKGIYYEGFVSTMLFNDIFFHLRFGNFQKAKQSILFSRKFNLYCAQLYKEYGKMPKHFLRRAKLSRILLKMLQLEQQAKNKNNINRFIYLVKKYLYIGRIFMENMDYETFKNRITYIIADILNDNVFPSLKTDSNTILNALTSLENVFKKEAEFHTQWWKSIWLSHADFIKNIQDVVKLEKEGKIEEVQRMITEIQKKYPIAQFLNIKKEPVK
jgi:hypothetical protein